MALAPSADVVFEVVAADEAVIVVDKPAGLVVHPAPACVPRHWSTGCWPASGSGEWRLARPRAPGHRASPRQGDVGAAGRGPHPGRGRRSHGATAGPLGRTDVHGAGDRAPQHDAGTIDAPVGRSTRDRTRMAVAAGRERAHELPRARAPRRRDTRRPARVQAGTGRTHQIRVHLSAIGHAVAGDTRYKGRSPSGYGDRSCTRPRSVRPPGDRRALVVQLSVAGRPGGCAASGESGVVRCPGPGRPCRPA